MTLGYRSGGRPCKRSQGAGSSSLDALCFWRWCASPQFQPGLPGWRKEGIRQRRPRDPSSRSKALPLGSIIEHVAGAGILAYKSEQGQIDHNVVVDRLADGIHLIEARYNTVLSNKWGRWMSVVGGKHVLLEHNLVDGVDAA